MRAGRPLCRPWQRWEFHWRKSATRGRVKLYYFHNWRIFRKWIQIYVELGFESLQSEKIRFWGIRLRTPECVCDSILQYGWWISILGNDSDWVLMAMRANPIVLGNGRTIKVRLMDSFVHNHYSFNALKPFWTQRWVICAHKKNSSLGGQFKSNQHWLKLWARINDWCIALHFDTLPIVPSS